MNDKRVRQVIGRTIREHRLKCGLTQEQLATRAGLHRTYVGAVDAGVSGFTTSR
ncbi:MAG: helix-turn-helix domain-containing protein [Gemmatimonadota bacterium]|nr:helix-turn-helix domain-containing protein [Gemmatimonadota bacterium]MDH3423965.1 helix-turn-helix domain-containing protein [Gemmatimonadota bacterium]